MLTNLHSCKVRKLAFKIIHSMTIILPAWDAACKEAGMGMRRIPWDVSTRWNSTFDMVSFVVEYRTPVDALTDKHCLGLAAYALDEHEWLVLGQLCEVLKILKDATLFFSCGMPNLAMVIPAMDYIDEIFMTTMLDDTHLDPSIRAAVGLVKRTSTSTICSRTCLISTVL
ncbi:hypothetical protein PISMIDRAFT_110451 [Pisolithus microcarpus 441]|uniref:Uncharacterized protein n=1 Tax=Pisolithus microcarpus 441 TaxID=765257 RepID=A0A0C9YV57_9AGAM|nr:hypothetical protein PISMIDRAFT_110451 [Pisolithus microcarpus 441]